MLPYGGSPPSSGISPRTVGTHGPSPAPTLPWLRGSHPPGRACHALGAHAAIQGGYPICPAPCAETLRPPPPPAHAQFVRAAQTGGPRPRPGPCLLGGVLLWSALPPPPLPPLHASGVLFWAGGSPPPSLPPGPLALGAGCRLGGSSSPIALRGSPALQDLARDHPLVQGAPLTGGSPSTDTRYGS